MALPRRHRLKGQRVFDALYRRGRQLHSPHLSLRWHPVKPALEPAAERGHAQSPWRCGVVISSKVHKRAVRRNHLRRLLHNHLTNQGIAPCQGPIWLLLSLKPGSVDREDDALLEECEQLLHRAGLRR
ncbi:ribonuclease P protein component [Cyanobium sp. NS01]|uniref:ribonuclease P protein component n=1 Tax=Cyanobium sp. NS01 TaxID=261284 RepID=UPI0016452BDE|nr:ribonuclease P protein component [Cyanobium sp. NS01]QNI71364.1 ribonuclease P protein component [Cyanobium sp. NS01]